MAAMVLSLSGTAVAQSSGPASQAGGNQSNAELFFMLEQLQREMRQLRGELEEQRNELDRLTRQSRERYIDLDQRLLDLSSQPRPAQPAAGASAATTGRQAPLVAPVTRDYRPPGQQERAKYDEIIRLIREQRAYDEAIDRLYAFIGEYPEGDLTVNAYYWLGEVYLVKPQLEQAKQAFTIVTTRFADHRKAPDAVFKLGMTHDRMGEKTAARERMQQVVNQYADSDAARLAKDYLQRN